MSVKKEKLLDRLWWLPYLLGIVSFVFLVGQSFFIALIVAVFVFFIAVFYIGHLDDKNEKREKELNAVDEKRRQEEAEAHRKLKAEEDATHAKLKAEEDAIRKQRQSYAADLKNKARITIEKCDSNKKTGEQSNLQSTYESVRLQENVWNVINGISLKMQKIESTVEELKIKGG